MIYKNIKIIGAGSQIIGFPPELKDLTAFEIEQLKNIDTSPFSSAQWARLSAIDQDLKTNSSVIFGGMIVNGLFSILSQSNQISRFRRPNLTSYYNYLVLTTASTDIWRIGSDINSDDFKIHSYNLSTDIFKIDNSFGILNFYRPVYIEYLTPDLFLVNTALTDADGERKSFIVCKGTQSGGEVTILGKFGFCHDGSSDDQRGRFAVYVNDGFDGDSPNEVFRIDRLGRVALGGGIGAPSATLHIASTGDNQSTILQRPNLESYSNYIYLRSATTNNWRLGSTANNNDLVLYSYGADKNILSANYSLGTLTSAGNVLISKDTPVLTLLNTTPSDAENSRLSIINFVGRQSGNEQSTLVTLSITHDGTLDDQKGKIRIGINDGDDDNSPTELINIKSEGIGISLSDQTALLDLSGSTTDRSNFRIRNGIDPTSPNIGDVWSTSTLNGKLNYRKNALETIDLANQPLAEIFINTIADLPAAVSGKITLLANTLYTFNFQNTIVLTDELVIPNRCIVQFANIQTSQTINLLGRIQYSNIANTAGGIMFYGVNTTTGALYRIIESNLSFSSIVGTFFNFSSTVPAFFVLREIAFLGPPGTTFGQIYDFTLSISTIGCQFLGAISGGFLFENNSLLFINDFELPNGANLPLNIINVSGTTQGRIFFDSLIFNNSGSGVYAFNFDSSTTYTKGVNVINGSITDSTKAFAPGSYNQKTLGFKFYNNYFIQNSTVTIQGCAQSVSYITTNIPAISAQVFLNLGTNWVWCDSERITATNDGTITYNGLEKTTLLIDSNIELKPNSGTNQLLRTQFAKISDAHACTFTNATDRINETATSRVNDDRICFLNTTGTLPTGLRKDVIYWVINKLTDSFQVSYTQGGAAVTFTDDGTPPNFYNITQMVGGTGRGQITNPLQFVPQALSEMSTGHQIKPIVWNDTTSNHIDSQYAYLRVKE